MVEIVVEKTGSAKTMRAKVIQEETEFDRRLVFRKVDKKLRAKTRLEDGKYELLCSVAGKAGATFRVEITWPPDAVCAVSGTVPSSGFGVGGVEFSVEGSLNE